MIDIQGITLAFGCYVLPIIIMGLLAPFAQMSTNLGIALIWSGLNCIVFGGIMGKEIPVRNWNATGFGAYVFGGFWVALGIHIWINNGF